MAAPAATAAATTLTLPAILLLSHPKRCARLLELHKRLDGEPPLTADEGLLLCQLAAWLHDAAGPSDTAAWTLPSRKKTTTQDLREVVRQYLPAMKAESSLAFGRSLIGLWVWLASKDRGKVAPDSDAFHATRAWTLRRFVIEGLAGSDEQRAVLLKIEAGVMCCCQASNYLHVKVRGELGEYPMYGKDVALVHAELARRAGGYMTADAYYMQCDLALPRVDHFLRNRDLFGLIRPAGQIIISEPYTGDHQCDQTSLRRSPELRKGDSPEEALLALGM